MNVIGDIAGRFDELMLLLDKMPKSDFTVYVGDLNDRGPKSKEVIEHVMNSPESYCAQSNHGDMMVDFYDGIKRYSSEDFLKNGGTATLKSYDCGLHNGDIRAMVKEFRSKVPESHINWLRDLPYYYENGKVFVSHAAKDPTRSLDSVCTNYIESIYYNILWNRGEPGKMDGKLQIMGHNSHWSLKRFGVYNNPYAMCIDGSKDNMLTGLHVPTLTIYQQEYLSE